MGTYVPIQRKKKRSVADTLLEAEQEHYLDCPNADIPIRSAALLLDLILFSIATSGMHHLIETVRNSVPFFISAFAEPATPIVVLLITYFAWVVKTAAFVLYFVWSVSRFGGSPAKLIMGLRVVDAQTGDRLNYQRAFVREVLAKPFGLLLLVGAVMAVSREDRRALHDLIAHSTVKRVRGLP